VQNFILAEIRGFCETFLSQNINEENWYRSWSCADIYRLPDLRKSVAIYVGENIKRLFDNNKLETLTSPEMKEIMEKSQCFVS